MTKVSELREFGMDSGGFVDTEAAVAVGMDPKSLSRMALRGRLTRELQGIYRFPEVPVDETTEYRLALLWAGPQAVIDSESVLVLLGLCDVNPRELHVAVPPGVRVRRKGKEHYRLHRGKFDVEYHRGLPMVSVHQAISRALDHGLRHELARQAIRTASRRDLILDSEALELHRHYEIGGTGI
ncbi:type IV toxin-antitoxin system AbiEi family antitoxin domain-containing protein [Paenarthrobacter sp. NPDC056912]|uniref:type IV toxin-antitoxin system AbiEi family antitoxin domain-containing protein n=1 Tax=Paenarthrobacter sp. NPDC056912 TaxID=3345965 RepID=UPI0036702C0C